MVKYCNVTTDLRRAYAPIEEMQWRALRIIPTKALKNHSTESVYKMSGTGNVEAVYEDSTKLTLAASIAAVNAVGEWFYDSTNDVLYIYATGGVPANHTYQYGEDWDTVKSDMAYRASREAESLLDKDVPVPIPMSPAGDLAHPYDLDFTHAVAKNSLWVGLDRVIPATFDTVGNATNEAAQLLFSGRAAIRQYSTHEKKFSWEVTKDEIGGANITPYSTNTSAGMIQIRGLYTPSTLLTGSVLNTIGVIFPDPFWIIKITTGGILGTSQWQVSTDNGTTYNGTDTATSNQWAHIGNNLWIRFLARAGTSSDFVANDTWQLEIQAPDKSVTNPKVKSFQMTFQ